MSNEMIESIDVIFFYNPFDDPQSEDPRYKKCPERAKGEANGRVYRPANVPKKKPPYETGDFPGNGCEDDLEHLYQNKDEGRVRAKGKNEKAQFFIIEKEPVIRENLSP